MMLRPHGRLHTQTTHRQLPANRCSFR